MRFQFKKTFINDKVFPKGVSVIETMSFVSFEKACIWAQQVSMFRSIPYIVEWMKNLETGEVEKIVEI